MCFTFWSWSLLYFSEKKLAKLYMDFRGIFRKCWQQAGELRILTSWCLSLDLPRTKDQGAREPPFKGERMQLNVNRHRLVLGVCGQYVGEWAACAPLVGVCEGQTRLSASVWFKAEDTANVTEGISFAHTQFSLFHIVFDYNVCEISGLCLISSAPMAQKTNILPIVGLWDVSTWLDDLCSH